jgi:hypothetical protein
MGLPLNCECNLQHPWECTDGVIRCGSPHWLRSKSGIAEAYAAGIFKASKEQNFPLNKFIRVLPDLTFFIVSFHQVSVRCRVKSNPLPQEVINDLLSFHKEELAGETYNLIHLRTRALSASGARGSGLSGEWTVNDTVELLCDEIREATHRIDGLLRLDDCEKKLRGEPGLDDIDEADIEIAKQWRGWRDGYICWHFECRRYRLGSLRQALFDDSTALA